jgi:capsular polysaccharide biosynthesis protein
MTDIDQPEEPEELVESDGADSTSSRWGRTAPAAKASAPRSSASSQAEHTDSTPNLTEVRVITQQAVIDEGGVRPLRALILHLQLARWIFGVIFFFGLVYGLAADTEYEAEVELFVGRLDAPVEAIPSLVAANEELAQNYSRLLSDPDLIADIAAATGLEPSEVRHRVSATQVVSSPFIIVTGTGRSAGEARELTDITGELLTAVANDFASVSNDPIEILATHDEQLVELNEARSLVEILERGLLDDGLTAAEFSSLSAQKGDAQAEVDRLTFRVSVLESQYEDAIRATSSEGLVRRSSDVEDGGSNRLGNLSLGLAIGLLGGIVVAIGVVTLLELIKIAQADPSSVAAET